MPLSRFYYLDTHRSINTFIIIIIIYHSQQPSLTLTHPCLCLCVFFFSTLISRLARAMTSDTLDSVTLVNDIWLCESRTDDRTDWQRELTRHIASDSSNLALNTDTPCVIVWHGNVSRALTGAVRNLSHSRTILELSRFIDASMNHNSFHEIRITIQFAKIVILFTKMNINLYCH